MCSDEYKTRLTLERKDFLEQWLIGSEVGDLCRGSQVPESYLKQFRKNEEAK
jgi:hypothetical protein